jgi:hypothetical protein
MTSNSTPAKVAVVTGASARQPLAPWQQLKFGGDGLMPGRASG